MRQPTPNILDDVFSAPKPPTMLAVEAIQTDGGTQMRAAVDEGTVSEYATIFQESRQWGNFPPVVVFYDGAEYWLADGFHRVAAWKRSGNAQIGARIPADVRAGTRRDAILYAAGANASHGLRRTNADKRRAVEVLLRDEEWRQWSDGEIARRCFVSDRFVANMRKELTPNGSESTLRRGADGRVINTANIGANRPVAQSPSRRYDSGLPALDMPMQFAGASVVASDATHTRQACCASTAAATKPGNGLTPELEREFIRRYFDLDQLLKQDNPERCMEWTIETRKSVVSSPWRWNTRSDVQVWHASNGEYWNRECDAKYTHTRILKMGLQAFAEMQQSADSASVDTRPERISALIVSFRSTISHLEQYGELTGRFTDTLVAQRELEKLIDRLGRERMLLSGLLVEAENEAA